MSNLPGDVQKVLDQYLKPLINSFDPTDPTSTRPYLMDELPVNAYVYPTGLPSVDWALSGGFGFGRIVELYGENQSGKTTLALYVAGQILKSNPNAMIGYVDAEGAVDRKRAEQLGVDTSRTLIYSGSYGEDMLQQVVNMINDAPDPTPPPAGVDYTGVRKRSLFKMIIVDSVAALMPRAMMEADLGESRQMGQHARLMSEGVRKIQTELAGSDTVVVFINQLRNDPNKYGDTRETTGGKALKFYASTRIEVKSNKKDKLVRPGDPEPYGQTTHMTVVKHKTGPSHRTANFDVVWEDGSTGINATGSVLDTAVMLGLIHAGAGGVFKLVDFDTGEISSDTLIRGRQNMVDLLNGVVHDREEEGAMLHARLVAELDAKLRGEPVSDDTDADTDAVDDDALIDDMLA